MISWCKDKGYKDFKKVNVILNAVKNLEFKNKKFLFSSLH